MSEAKLNLREYMELYTLIKGPVLRLALIVLAFGILGRTIKFIFSVIRNANRSNGASAGKNGLFALLWLMVPFHKGFGNNLFYASTRYGFHISMFVVVIFFSGHIMYWEESRFELSWPALPDMWSDGLTIAILILLVCFLTRRIVLEDLRRRSVILDYIIIVMTALPFATGYSLAHWSLDNIPLLGNQMLTIHIISGEIMIVAVTFLFCTTHLDRKKCMGCSACTLNCPMNALESQDKSGIRFFNFSPDQCVYCGACVATCPDDAVELKHELSFIRFFKTGFSQKNEVELERCEECGLPFIPVLQLSRIEKVLPLWNESPLVVLNTCERCKRLKIRTKIMDID